MGTVLLAVVRTIILTALLLLATVALSHAQKSWLLVYGNAGHSSPDGSAYAKVSGGANSGKFSADFNVKTGFKSGISKNFNFYKR
jgi:hypothetical protein